jgi:outer membrane PBP1 activator LpoA protein
MASQQQDEVIGKLYRCKDAERKRLALIDAELSTAAELLKTAATQLDKLLSKQPSEVQPALSRVDVNSILKLLAERQLLQRRIAEANEKLKALGVDP